MRWGSDRFKPKSKPLLTERLTLATLALHGLIPLHRRKVVVDQFSFKELKADYVASTQTSWQKMIS